MNYLIVDCLIFAAGLVPGWDIHCVHCLFSRWVSHKIKMLLTPNSSTNCVGGHLVLVASLERTSRAG
jgi:hypothetical protein